MATQQNISHTARMRGQYNYNRLQVLWLTGMSHEDLSTFQFETGIAWLSAHTGETQPELRLVLQQPVIWAWWLNAWHRRDDACNLKMLYGTAPASRQAQYRSWHQEVFISTAPPYYALENAYARAIGEMLDEVKKAKI